MLIGVDGGADALLELGFQPDIIIGDFDSAERSRGRRAARSCCTTCIPTGARPGRENLEAMGLAPGRDYQEFVAEGMSEDVAMLLAYEAGASLIVAVGTHSTMVEMLDKGRQGHGVDVPDPTAARAGARRRQGRAPPVRGPGAPP